MVREVPDPPRPYPPNFHLKQVQTRLKRMRGPSEYCVFSSRILSKLALYLLHYNRVNSDLLLPVAVHASSHASFPDTYSQHMRHIVLGSLPEVVFRNTD
jgi:hypothetical protein